MEASGSEDDAGHDAVQLAAHMAQLQSPDDLQFPGVLAAAGPGQAAVPSSVSFSRVPTARKDEVQRVLGQCLVLKCDVNGPYLAPVVTLGGEESNIYTLVERHFKDEYLVGSEKFWRLVRAEMQVDTWRPRVQGTQLKALQGARLPQTEAEFENISRVVQSLQDCLKPESSQQQFMHDLRTTITQIQAWWENRNRRPDGGLKRGAPSGAPPVGTKKRLSQSAAQGNAALLGGLHLLTMDGQQVLGAAANLLPPGLQQQDPRGFADLAGADDGAGLGSEGPFQANGHAAGAADAAFNHNPLSALLNSQDITAPLTLDVGGRKFKSTLKTLVAAQGSIFWQLVQGQGPAGVIHRLPSGELFIDRSGEVFAYVLEYLRACANSEATFPLPNDARELQALAREASFYQLPVLLEHISESTIMPQPATRTCYDSLYLETGFRAIEGPEVAEMEQAKQLMMQQLNHVLSVRSQQGCYVDQINAGVDRRTKPTTGANHAAHQDSSSSGTSDQQVNLYLSVVLKRVVPVVHDALLEANGAGEQAEDDEGPGEAAHVSDAEE